MSTTTHSHPHPAGTPGEIMKVEISLHASKLKNVAGAFKGTSDPFAVVTQVATVAGEKPKVLGKTEVVENTLNPQWVKVFYIDYELGTPVKVAVNIFDEVKKGDNKSMGSAVFDIGECLGARGNTKAKKLAKGGTVFCAVRKSMGSGLLRLKLKGSGLKNVEGGIFGKSDPFFELSRKVNSAGYLTWDNVFRSKVVKNNLNPDWEDATIELNTLCNGALDDPILVSVFDFETSGKHVPMGQFETSVNGLVNASKKGEGLVLKQKGKDFGKIIVASASVTGVEQVTQQMQATSLSASSRVNEPLPPPMMPPSAPYAQSSSRTTGNADFLDYITGGCEINVVVGIDFTGSNGDPRKPGTLHYLGSGPQERNDYEKAIAAIVSVLEKYDSDQQFPVYGFGAKYNGVVNHCFPCGRTPEVRGVAGILEAYRQVFSTGLIMSSPTVFTEVIETAAQRAASSQEKARQKGCQAYTILLIVTDGAVSDVHATAATLDRVSDSPLSVVIVGVGGADFSGMQFLDDSSKPGKRDVAQFVEFNKHRQNSVALTSETLNEIPNQLVGYFQSKGIAPLPPMQRSDSVIVADPAEEEIDLSLDIKEDDVVVTGGGEGFVDGFNASR
jgi:hypothetical protein